MKRVFILLMVFMSCVPCFAHGWLNNEDDDLCVFGEVGGGLVLGGKRYPTTFGENSLGYNGYIELRYRLSNPHFDVGLYGGYGEFKRKNRAGFSKVFDTLDVLFTVNYNLLRSGKIRPFIGVGAGVVNDSAVDFLTSMVLPDKYFGDRFYGNEYYRSRNDASFGLMLRAGIQFGTLFRLTGGYKFIDSQSSHAFLTLGINIALGAR